MSDENQATTMYEAVVMNFIVGALGRQLPYVAAVVQVGAGMLSGTILFLQHQYLKSLAPTPQLEVNFPASAHYI